MKRQILIIAVVAVTWQHCSTRTPEQSPEPKKDSIPAVAATYQAPIDTIQPLNITDTVRFDTDDPAIWINPNDPASSLIVGTDKNEDGGLYLFDLKGKIVKTIDHLKRPDNVDIEYGLTLGSKSVDIAVVTERLTHNLRIFTLPGLTPIDGGGVPVFEGETGEAFRDLMGIALYKNPATKKIYAIVGRKSGPTDGSYLWQYLLEDSGKGTVKATLVRKFGQYSGKKEIEAIAVDDEPGFVYYADEGVGVRQYYADPEKGNAELAFFAQKGFTQDHEGISIYKTTDSTGYILVSDQSAHQFFIFTREGKAGDPHDHELVKVVRVAAIDSDGSDITSVPLNADFPRGLFVVMSADKTFHYYRWEDIAGRELKIRETHQ